MISDVALARPAVVVALVRGFPGSKAAQTVGSEQALRADVDDGFLLLCCERGDGQGDSKNLIRAERSVIADSGRINDVEAATTIRIPEFLKALLALRGEALVVPPAFLDNPSEPPRL